MRNRILALCCIGGHLAIAQTPAAEPPRPDDVLALDKLEIKGASLPHERPGANAPAVTPLQIKPTSELGFPNALANTLVTDGWARVMIAVDATGNLTDLMVAGYTHKAFAREATRALREWKYVPARENGQPIGVRMTLTVDFNDNKAVIKMWQMGDIDQAPGFKRERVIKGIYEPRELDGPVKAIEMVPPANPAKAIAAATDSNVVRIDFIIDELGRPRMPVVAVSPHDAFAQAAIDALLQWRFTPPLRYGEAVAVQIQKEFVFTRSKRG